MCGIAGIVDYGSQPSMSKVVRMMGLQRHRGPDGSGVFRDRYAVLGHNRLAIIDQAGGAQPLTNEDGSIWITFNGEIFNYVELGEELRALGHRFRTASDTEVIVHAWEQWGPECFTRFNGQWAVGLWDRRSRHLILARDRLGVRPLFLRRTANGIAFASEVKALLSDPTAERAFDPVGLDQVMTYWSTVAPRTVFKGITQLPPGHFAVLDETQLRVRPFWTPDFPEQGREPVQDLAANVAQLRERLVEAARLRFLRSDVPVGAYLSGGIDSSVTAAVIARYTDAPLRTFSLRFADSEFDEGRYQRLMAQRLGTEHQEIEVTSQDIAEVFPEVVWHAESPILRSAPAPLLLLSRLVRESGYKVVVTGEGADEVLAGYDIFRESRVRLFWSRDPQSAKRSRAVELLYPWMARSPSSTPAFAKSFFARNLDPDDPAVSHRPRWDSTSALKSMLNAEMRECIGTGASGRDLIATMPAGHTGWDPLSRAQWLEMATLLPGYILASQGDRMLMANSVEGRFPFLDRDVVEVANRMPSRHKLLGLDEKHVLKRAFADLVPEEILRRPKQPYRAPDAASFFDGRPPEWFDATMNEDALRSAGVFDPGAVRGLIAKCARRSGRQMGNTDNMRLLAVVSTQLTHHHFLAGPGPASVPPPPEPMTVHDFGTEEWRAP